MAWMMDEYETMVGEHHPGVITGKPLPLGGSEGRGDATARGGIYVTREAAKELGIDLAGKTMAIQGFGNAGQYAALLGHEILGLKLVAASDSKGGIYNPKGLDPRTVVDYKLKTGSVQGFPGAEPISNEALLELEVTVLFPAALENVITADERRPDQVPGSPASWPTARPRRRRMRSCSTKASSSCRTSWPTPAASPSPTSSRCRTPTTSTGRSARCTSAWTRR